MGGSLQIGVHIPFTVLSPISRVLGPCQDQGREEMPKEVIYSRDRKGRVRKGKPDLSSEERMWRMMDGGGKDLGRWSMGNAGELPTGMEKETEG